MNKDNIYSSIVASIRVTTDTLINTEDRIMNALKYFDGWEKYCGTKDFSIFKVQEDESVPRADVIITFVGDFRGIDKTDTRKIYNDMVSYISRQSCGNCYVMQKCCSVVDNDRSKKRQ